MPKLEKIVVCSGPRSGTVVGALLQQCPTTGLVIVTVTYGVGGMAQDADVEISPGYVRKLQHGNIFIFEITQDALYDVTVTSQHWSEKFGYEYSGAAEPNHITTITVPLYPQPALTLTCRDHHFAPAAETLDAFFTCTNLERDTIKLTVRGTNYASDIVHRNDNAGSADGDHPLNWNGSANVGALAGGFLNPLFSPYTIRVEGEHSGLSATAQFHVLYRDVRLAIGTYTADGQPPDQNADRRRWVQYRLNELGYFAGPVDGNIPRDGQTHRAMMRYAYQHPGFDEQEAEGDNYATFPDDNAFALALQNGEQPRQILQGGALPPRGVQRRAYIEHNYFYYDLPEFVGRPAGHKELDEAKLDRFELPLELTISLMSRTDANGTGPGVLAHPEAVGEVKVEWSASEVPENPAIASSANRPTKATAYLNAALTGTMEDYRTNCPVALGGSRQPAGQVNQGHFRIGTQLPPYTTTTAGDRVFSTAHQGAHANKRGKAGILFRASYIAGDNFLVEARLSFHGLPNEAALEQAHRAVMGARWEDARWQVTGGLQIWRKSRVSHVINWPAPAGPPIRWAEVAAEYAAAYIELDHGNITTITGAQLLGNYQNLQGTNLQTLVGGMVGFSLHSQMMGTYNFSPNHVLALNIPPQGPQENGPTYRQRVLTWLDTEITMQSQQYLAYGIAKVIDCVASPGTTIIHGKWCPTISIVHRVKFVPDGLVRREQLDPGLYCVGLARGVTILSNAMYPDYQHRFLVAHEMAHSRFLRHHETGKSPQADPHHVNNNSDNPDDHDLRDHNCVMCYPWGVVSRPNLAWGPNNATQAAFCGKCLLKLRGWDVSNAAMPRESPP